MKVDLTHRAVKDLERLERSQPELHEKVLSRVLSLVEDPHAGKPLVGPLKGKRSARVGPYRVIYQVKGGRIVVLTVNHRGEVYR